MGTQQIILIILSAIILGTGTLALMHYFTHTTRNTDRQNMISEMQIFAAQIVNYYNTPRRMQGGGLEIKSEDLLAITAFIKFDKDGNYDNDVTTYLTEKVSYSLSIDGDSVKMTGIGKEKGNDRRNKIQVTMLVTPSNSEPIEIKINN